MFALFHRVRHLLKSTGGATAVEYAILLALIIMATLFAIQTVGAKNAAMYNDIATKMPTR